MTGIATPLRSALPGIVFPAVLSPAAAAALALQVGFEQSERWPPARLRAAQLLQLERLLAHCYAEVPFMADRLRRAGLAPGRKLTLSAWRRLPLLTRAEVQSSGPALRAAALPEGHGQRHEIRTSGSSGAPVCVEITDLTARMREALGLRAALWDGADLSGTLAVIHIAHGDTTPPARPRRYPHHGAPTGLVFRTGANVQIDLRVPVAEQVALLARHKVSIVYSFPSNLTLLAQYCAQTGTHLPHLKHVHPVGEVVTQEFRDLCRRQWGASVRDIYSAAETAQLGLQCPTGTHFHVPETVLLEALDEAGNPCRAGQVGRVVVTPLLNFATPLLRYEIGDLAELGGRCACGRTLPVLRRVLGRTRDKVRLPGGETRHAFFNGPALGRVDAIRQYQLVQTAPDQLELHTVLRRPLNADEQAFISQKIGEGLGYPFAVRFVTVDTIPRTAGGKYLDFRSEIA